MGVRREVGDGNEARDDEREAEPAEVAAVRYPRYRVRLRQRTIGWEIGGVADGR